MGSGSLLLKVCGARTASDVTTLAEAGADWVGLWHGVGGRAELTRSDVVELAGTAHATGRLDPVLVTLSGDPALVADVAVAAGIRRVQLHGYQPPGMVRRIKATDLQVVKVLHVLNGHCVDAALIPAYQRAGIDVFLVDAIGARIGSTGTTADPAAVLAVADAVDRPILLAGGLRVGSAARFTALLDHPRLIGLDVDTGARDHHGRFDPATISLLRAGWRREACDEPVR